MNLCKTCTTCKNLLSLDCFSPDKRATDGKQSRCRKCARSKKNQAYHADPEKSKEKGRAYYRENSEKVNASNAKSRAKHRDVILERKRDYYGRVKTDPEWQAARKEERAANKEAKKEYDKDYREKNAEKCNAQSKKWKAANREKRRSIAKSYKARRKAIEKDGDPTAVIHEWEMSAPKVCHWCAKDCADNYHVDHYYPLSKGGKHEVSNLVIACPPCNLKKNSKLPEEFAAELEKKKAA